MYCPRAHAGCERRHHPAMNTPLGLTTLLLSVIAHVAPVSARPSAEEVEAAEIACAKKVEAECLTTIALSLTEPGQYLYLKALTNGATARTDTINYVPAGRWDPYYKHLLLQGRWDEAEAAIAKDRDELRIRQNSDGEFDEPHFAIRDEVIEAQLLYGQIDLAIATARSTNNSPGEADALSGLIVNWLIQRGQMDEAVSQLRSLGRGLGTERGFREGALLKVALAYARAGETVKADRTVKMVRASPEVCRTQMLVALAVDRDGDPRNAADRLTDIGRDALSSGEIKACLPFAFDGLMAVGAHDQAANLAQAALGTLKLLPARDATEYAMWSRIVTALRSGGREDDAMALSQLVLRINRRALTGDDAVTVATTDYLRFYFSGSGPSEADAALRNDVMLALVALDDSRVGGVETLKYLASITDFDTTIGFLFWSNPGVWYGVPSTPIYDELTSVQPEEVIRSLPKITYAPSRANLAKVAGLRLYRMGQLDDARRVLAEGSAGLHREVDQFFYFDEVKHLAEIAYLQRRIGFIADADLNLTEGYKLARTFRHYESSDRDTAYFMLAQAALAQPD